MCINGPGLANFIVWASSEPFRAFFWNCRARRNGGEGGTESSCNGSSSDTHSYESSLLHSRQYAEDYMFHHDRMASRSVSGGGERDRSDSLDVSFMSTSARDMWGDNGEERGRGANLSMGPVEDGSNRS